MDKAEFQRLTNEARGQPLRMEGFEHLIPGWTNRVAHPYNLLIEAGIRSEVARLTGKRYLVVMSRDVVESVEGYAANRRVVSVVVVEVEPAGQRQASFGL